MVNAVINQDTSASLEYCQLIQDQTPLPLWNKAAANEFGRLAQGVWGRIEGSNKIFFIPLQATPKEKLSLMDALWWTSVPTNLILTVSALLWLET
jgi:hypothetical protein